MINEKIDAIMTIARGNAVNAIRKPFAIKDGQVLQWYEPFAPALFLFYIYKDDAQNITQRNANILAGEHIAIDIAKRYWHNTMPSINRTPSLEKANDLYKGLMEYSKRHANGHMSGHV